MEAEGPEAKVLLADHGYDSDHIRETVEEKGAAPVIPTRRNRKVQIRSMATSMPCATASSAASINSRTREGWRPLR